MKDKASERFGVRLKPTEESLLISLAEILERSLSDTFRFAIRHTARDYGLLPKKDIPKIQRRKKGIPKERW